MYAPGTRTECLTAQQKKERDAANERDVPSDMEIDWSDREGTVSSKWDRQTGKIVNASFNRQSVDPEAKGRQTQGSELEDRQTVDIEDEVDSKGSAESEGICMCDVLITVLCVIGT